MTTRRQRLVNLTQTLRKMRLKESPSPYLYNIPRFRGKWKGRDMHTVTYYRRGVEGAKVAKMREVVTWRGPLTTRGGGGGESTVSRMKPSTVVAYLRIERDYDVEGEDDSPRLVRFERLKKEDEEEEEKFGAEAAEHADENQWLTLEELKRELFYGGH